MWKSGFRPCGARIFCSQHRCKVFHRFHNRVWENFFIQVVHRQFIHNSQRLWTKFCYSLALTLAVISFSAPSSGLLGVSNVFSTFLMAWITEV